MIHASHASHIQMQMSNAKCEMQIAKICNQCDFWVGLPGVRGGSNGIGIGVRV